ncbi:protein kinase [Myxococcota bacterium]|nr:protein kinase [Myxococcota bacterium]
MAELVGSRVGRYRFVKEVGRGGMARVYKAVAEFVPERWVAIKVLSDHHNASEEVRARLQQEAQIQCRLSHPNIGQVLGLIDEEGIFALVMEWIDGVDLRTFMRQQNLFGLSIEQIQNFFLPILEAMAFVHRHHIVHRDIKPANIMLHITEERITPKILDFGIAKMLESSFIKTKEGSLLGTITYISPEQIRGLPPTPSMDIYSLGISLYELLVGHPPFRGGYTDVLIAHTEAEPDDIRNFRTDLPDGLNDIVMRALAKDPTDRFPSCDAFRQALEDLFDQTIDLQQVSRVRTAPIDPKNLLEILRAVHGIDLLAPQALVGPPPDLFPRLAALPPPPSTAASFVSASSDPYPSVSSASSQHPYSSASSTPSQHPYSSASSTPSQHPYSSASSEHPYLPTSSYPARSPDASTSSYLSANPHPSAYPAPSYTSASPSHEHEVSTDPMPATQQIPAEALEILYPSAKSTPTEKLHPSSSAHLASADSSPSIHGYIPQPVVSSHLSDVFSKTREEPFDVQAAIVASHYATTSPTSLAETAPMPHHAPVDSVISHLPSTPPPPTDTSMKTGILIGLAVGVFFTVVFFVIFSFLR